MERYRPIEKHTYISLEFRPSKLNGYPYLYEAKINRSLGVRGAYEVVANAKTVDPISAVDLAIGRALRMEQPK